MKNVLFALGLTAALSAPAFACKAPENRPEIPDPSTADAAQMVQANSEVREYVQSQEAYLNCASMNASEKRQALSQLEEYAESFNKAVREFRSASR